MRGFVSSLFCLFVAVTSVIVLGVGIRWMATHQLGELDGILLLTGFLMGGLIFAYRFFVADFEPLSITRGRPNFQLGKRVVMEVL
jgi:hypothetical protein